MPLFLFTGEEEFALHLELTKWKKGFVEKFGEYGLFDFSSDALDTEQIQNALLSGGMFSTKKLIILRGIPLDSITHNKAKASDIERCTQLLEMWNETSDSETHVLCISYKPDKRTKGYKRFTNKAQVKEFPLYDEKQKVAYAQNMLGSLLTGEQYTLLVALCSDNLGHLHNECLKLQQYAQYNNLQSYTTEQLNMIVWSNISSDNFVLLDSIYVDVPKSIELLTIAEQAGEDTFKFLGMLYRGLKTTLNILNLHEQGISDSKQLASLLKAHPFVISKQVKLLPKLQPKKEKIEQFYTDLLTLDYEIKTGILPVEGFWLAIKQALLKSA